MALQAPAEAGLAAPSAGWLVNGKAVAQEALGAALLLARDATAGPARQLAAQLTQTRRRLALLSSAARPEQAEERRRLAEQEEGLTRQLGALLGRPPDEGRWLEL